MSRLVITKDIVMRYNLVLEWLEKAKELQPGEEYHYAVANHEEQLRLAREVRRELKKYASINPVEASKFQVLMKYRDKHHFVYLRKIGGTPLVAFKKDTHGNISRVSIELKDRTKRIFKMMLEDNLSEEDMVRALGRELTDDERRKVDGRDDKRSQS